MKQEANNTKMRECPGCACEVPAMENRCPICGYEFPVARGPGRIAGWLAALMLALLLAALCRGLF